MNKADIVNKIYSENPGDFKSKAAAERAVNGTFSAIEAALSEGESVSLVGFGSFTVKERAARTVKNIQTGETMSVPAKCVVRFRAGKRLAEVIK